MAWALALLAGTTLIEDNLHGTDTGVRDFLAARGYTERLRTDCNVFFTKREDTRAFWL
jgi:hypothetical protein